MKTNMTNEQLIKIINGIQEVNVRFRNKNNTSYWEGVNEGIGAMKKQLILILCNHRVNDLNRCVKCNYELEFITLS